MTSPTTTSQTEIDLVEKGFPLMTEIDSSLSRSYWLMNCLSFKKSMRAVIKITTKEKIIKAIELVTADQLFSAMPDKIPDKTAVPAATTQIFSKQVSMKDCKNPAATGEGFVFLPKLNKSQ